MRWRHRWRGKSFLLITVIITSLSACAAFWILFLRCGKCLGLVTREHDFCFTFGLVRLSLPSFIIFFFFFQHFNQVITFGGVSKELTTSAHCVLYIEKKQCAVSTLFN